MPMSCLGDIIPQIKFELGFWTDCSVQYTNISTVKGLAIANPDPKMQMSFVNPDNDFRCLSLDAIGPLCRLHR